MRNPAKIVADTVRRLYDEGLTTMSGGNLSLRTDNGDIWVTPSALDKGLLTEEDMMCVASNGEVQGNTRVTSEFVVHKAILDARPDKSAVLHAHSPYTLGFSTARISPNVDVLAQASRRMGDRINISPYQKAGSANLAREVASHLSGDSVMTILENHGLFTVGDSLDDCYYNVEYLELCAKIWMYCAQLSANLRVLTETEKELLRTWTASVPQPDDALSVCENEMTDASRICTYMKRMQKRRINTSISGSMSVRTGDDSFIITPFFTDVRDLTPDKLVKVSKGRCEAGKSPDEMWELHEEIYERNPEVTTIITAVPEYLSAFCASDEELSSEPVWEAYYLLRDIPKVEFGRGREYFQSIAEQLGERVPTLMIRNDMYIVTSNDIQDAYDKVEVAESTAKGTVSTSLIKKPVKVEKEIIDMYDMLLEKMLFGRG